MRTITSMKPEYLLPSLELVEQVFTEHENAEEGALVRRLVEEIRSLLAEGIPPKATSLQAIGYKEFVDALTSSGSLEEAAAQVQQSSRRSAKRQLTWFRRNKQMHWLTRSKNSSGAEILAMARQVIAENDN